MLNVTGFSEDLILKQIDIYEGIHSLLFSFYLDTKIIRNFIV